MSKVWISYEAYEPSVVAAEVVNARLDVVAQFALVAGMDQCVGLAEQGSYLVRGWLPSGQQLTATLEAGQDRRVVLRPPRTPGAPDSAGESEPADEGEPTWALVWALQDAQWATVPTASPEVGPEGATLAIPVTPTGSVIVQVGGLLPTRMTVIPATGAARVSVQPDRQPGTPGWRWRVDVPDDAGLTLLRFMENGDLRSARILADAFLDRSPLRATPLLAAAVGYVLLRTGDREQLSVLTGSHRRWLDELPDGAVIRAWQQLHEPRPDLDRVRSLLRRAAGQLPVAAEGLRLLSRGLRMLDGQQHDDGLYTALQRIRPLAAAIALETDPLTAFSGRSPTAPSVLPVTTAPGEAGQAARHANPFGLPSVLRSATGQAMFWTQGAVPLEAARESAESGAVEAAGVISAPQVQRRRAGMTDPIADMLTRLRSANSAHDDTVGMPYSKIKSHIAEILQQEGYIAGWRVEEAEAGRELVITLKYGNRRERSIAGIKRISQPGLRVFAKKDKLPRVLGGLGVAIISTPSGLMTDKQAEENGVGGEVLAYVW